MATILSRAIAREYNAAWLPVTGGQPVDGRIGVPQIARQVEAEGAQRVAVVSDDAKKYQGHEFEFPRGTTFHHRSELDLVQRRLRDTPGVTVLIYDQTCAAEKRRRRKKNEYPDPPRRIFINEQVCEGCGDCGEQSNCLSVIPVETDWGRKRRIEQTSCNKDYSCVNGFCPSFVSVHGAVLRKHAGREYTAEDVARELERIGPPPAWNWTGPFDLLVAGVGGTGVVTVGALVTMAAHLEGRQASVLDFMGFAQKGGAVLSFVRLAPTPDLLNQVRIDTQQADLVLACDLVVGASPEALGTVKHDRTIIHVNTHETATAAFVRNPDADLHAQALLAKMRFAAGDERVDTVDAQAIAEKLLGDTMPSNIVMLGYAFQRGLVPVSEAALARAIEQNGVAVEMNRTAFALGRIAAASPSTLRRFAGMQADAPLQSPRVRPDWEDLDGETGLIERRARFLAEYQDAAYARRYRALVERVRAVEAERVGAPLVLTAAVSRYAAKLAVIKDEYEVARLYTDGRFLRELSAQFERWDRLSFHMAPPLLARPGPDGRPRKLEFGPWLLTALRLLAPLRRLRGTALDLFGRSEERRLERRLRDDYEAMIADLLPALNPANHALAIQIASVPERIRGYGHVKLASITLARARWKDLLDRYHGRAPQVEPVVVPLIRERVG